MLGFSLVFNPPKSWSANKSSMNHRKHWWLSTIDHRAVFSNNRGNYALVWEDGYKNTETFDESSEARERVRKNASEKLGVECLWVFQPK